MFVVLNFVSLLVLEMYNIKQEDIQEISKINIFNINLHLRLTAFIKFYCLKFVTTCFSKYYFPEAPLASVTPLHQKFVIGSRVRITCAAVAYPKPSFTWWRQGKQLSELDSRVFYHPTDGILTVESARRDDAGDWECLASNSQGEGRIIATLEYIGLNDYYFKILFANLIVLLICIFVCIFIRQSAASYLIKSTTKQYIFSVQVG